MTQCYVIFVLGFTYIVVSISSFPNPIICALQFCVYDFVLIDTFQAQSALLSTQKYDGGCVRSEMKNLP
jgi:hypothetical protein